MDRTKPKLWTKDFVVANAINIFYGFGFTMMIPLIPLYVVFRGGTDPDVGIIAAAFSASAIVMRFVTPPLLERMKKTSLLRLGVALSLLVTGSLAFMISTPGILIIRVLQGVGFGIVSTICATLAADLLPDTRRGEGIGYFGMGNVLMAALSPAAGLALVELSGFSAAFFAAAAGQVISIVFIAIFRPNPTIILPSPQTGPKPPLLTRIFDRALVLHAVLLVLFGMVRCAEMSYLPLLAAERGIAHLSVYYLVQTSTSFVIRFLAGNVYDRRGHFWIVIPSCVSFVLSLVLMAHATTLGPLLLAGVFNGASLGALQPCMQMWAISSVPPEKRGVASAVFYNFYDIGILIGSIVLGYIAVMFGYAGVYLVTCIPTVLFLVVYLVAMFRRKRRFS